MKKLFFLFLICLFYASCDQYDGKLRVINKTKRTVFIYEKIGENDKLVLPRCDDFEHYKNSGTALMKNLDTARLVSWGTWESTILENDTLIIMLFDSSRFESYCKGLVPFDSTYENYYYNRVFLEKNNWTIIINE